MFRLPLLTDLPNLRYRTECAINSITPDLLTKMLEEMDFSLNVYRITKKIHTEHL